MIRMSEKLSYTEAYEELSGIVSDLEEGEISVDELSAKVKRASLLIDICQKKLASTEEDVEQILKEMKDADDKEENGMEG